MSNRLLKSSSSVIGELRQLMASNKFHVEPIDVYIVPSVDPHRNEYVPDKFKRREFISKFDGSNGTAVVTLDKALLWTDGRYFVQADRQLDKNIWSLMKEGEENCPTINDWITKNVRENASIGVDPELISIDQWKSWKDKFDQFRLRLVPLAENLVDLVWKDDRPCLPSSPIWVYPQRLAGLSVDDKIHLVREKIVESKAEHLVVHRTDEIAWLFNLRGGDVSFNPIFLSFAIVSLQSSRIFVDEAKLSSAARQQLEQSQVEIHDYGQFYKQLGHIASNNLNDKFIVSPCCNSLVLNILSKERIELKENPICLIKSQKTNEEIEGMKEAHIKDGVALSCFFQWLEESIDRNEKITEIDCAAKLNEFRSQQEGFLYESFECIAAFAANGSIIHYRPTEETNKTIDRSSLFLIDSGGQYLEGTTDVTRTVHLGDATNFEVECATRVLKGMIELARCVFPPRTIGARLDSFARRSLWQIGLDYPHGTGHGVGTCLNVHEGPQSIGTRLLSETSLMSGMVLSDEPGFYLENQFGIRIENCLLVVANKTKLNNLKENNDWLRFEQLTLVPIQRKLIDENLLTRDEIDYVNCYHRQVFSLISARMAKLGLDEKFIRWLKKNTEPI